jgi:hypothetical protein
MGIPLRTIQDLVRHETPEKIFEYVPGLAEEKRAALIKSLQDKPIERRVGG